MSNRMKLLREALSLSSSDRTRLVDDLILSLEDESDPALGETWRRAIDQRVELVLAGGRPESFDALERRIEEER